MDGIMSKAARFLEEFSEAKSTQGYLIVTRLDSDDKTKFKSIEKSMMNFLQTNVRFDNSVKKIQIKDTDPDNPKGYTLIFRVLHAGERLQPVFSNKSYSIEYSKTKPHLGKVD